MRKEKDAMADTKNLCAQIPLSLHDRVCAEKDQVGLTTAQYITNLLIEYYQICLLYTSDAADEL